MYLDIWDKNESKNSLACNSNNVTNRILWSFFWILKYGHMGFKNIIMSCWSRLYHKYKTLSLIDSYKNRNEKVIAMDFLNYLYWQAVIFHFGLTTNWRTSKNRLVKVASAIFLSPSNVSNETIAPLQENLISVIVNVIKISFHGLIVFCKYTVGACISVNLYLICSESSLWINQIFTAISGICLLLTWIVYWVK